MQYPLISEYVRAIQDANNNLDKLAHLVPVQDDHGEPYRSSGAFAVVFKMKDEQTGKCYALKCFTEDQEGRAEAYRQIADELEFVDSSYITSVKYLEKEIFVDSSCEEDEFPVLLMDWIDGETMESYIAENYQDNYAMAMLCYRFCKMAAWLRSQPFAHGDIKPDNIMVRPDRNLTLVDYDGMFVPAMKGQKSPTIGTKDFSHPLRTVDDFDETIDDFALASIALSLKAISLKSSLLDEYGAADRLLFSAEDYRDLSKSKVLAALHELMNDEEVNMFLSMFLLANAKKNLGLCSFRLFNLYKPNNDIQELSLMKGRCNDEQIRKKIESITSLTDEDRKKSVVLFNVAYSADGKKLVSARCDWGIEFNISNFVVDAGVEIICDGAFDGCYSLTQVKLPAGLKYIGANAFRNCSLTEVLMPNTVLGIGSKAFNSCTDLQNISISDNLVYLGTGVFDNCRRLEKLVLPKSLSVISGNPFFNWHGNLQIVSDSFVYEQSILYDISKTKILACLSTEKSIKIPSSVSVIGDFAFCGCSFETVSMPTSIEYVGKCAFLNRYEDDLETTNYCWEGPYYGHSCLKAVRLSPKMKLIEDRLFLGCLNLMTVYIPYGIESIGISAFEDCEKLSEIIIPASVKVIKKNAFYGCKRLTKVVISEGIECIEESAFSWSALENIKLPKSLKNVGKGVFENCKNLNSLTRKVIMDKFGKSTLESPITPEPFPFP